jgi:ABC-type transport system involved in multi-copper enzyme maturation permease subunit
MLKDSLRETIDSKIFYVMVGISVLFTLIVLSVKFRMVSAEEQFRRATAQMTAIVGLFAQEGHGKGMRFDIEDFRQTNDAKEPWEGNYQFVYLIEYPDEKTAEQFKKQREFTLEGVKDQYSHVEWIDKVEVKQLDTKPTESRFLISTEGTRVKDRRGWVYEPSLFFGALPMPIFMGRLGRMVEFIADDLIGSFGAAIAMLISVVLTAFFIPNMLRKGTIDLLLAKPMHRVTLLVYKYIGGLAFMFLNTAVIMVGIWVALGLRTDLWVNGLLLCIFIFTFQFAIFYAVSTLMAVLTRSAIVAILLSVFTWAVLFVVGWGFQIIDSLRPEKLKDQGPQAEQFRLPNWAYVTADVIHFVTPHYKDMDVLTTKLIRSDLMDPSTPERKAIEKRSESINWKESLFVTCTFIVAVVGLSCFWFATRDY